MRFLTFFIAVSVSFSNSFGQSVPVRQMDSKLIGQDSVNIYYDTHYKIIESACASIIRYAHYNSVKGCFTGKFKDISKQDTSFVVSEGNYSDNGLKNGQFIVHYLTGALQAKGSFLNNDYNGDWVFYHANGHLREKSTFKNGHYSGKRELYNEDGSANTFMNITDDKCEITDVWGADGKKIIDNGNGDYIFFDGSLTWQGKLLNGVPDGVWTFQISNDVYGSEVFEKGKFLKGTNQNKLGRSDYEDKSRIKFLPSYPVNLAITNADRFLIGDNISCDGTDYSKYKKWKTKFLNKVMFSSMLTGSHWQ